MSEIVDVFLGTNVCDLCGHPIKKGKDYCKSCKKIVDKSLTDAKEGRISKLKINPLEKIK